MPILKWHAAKQTSNMAAGHVINKEELLFAKKHHQISTVGNYIKRKNTYPWSGKNSDGRTLKNTNTALVLS